MGVDVTYDRKAPAAPSEGKIYNFGAFVCLSSVRSLALGIGSPVLALGTDCRRV